jgi:hypothetical protein
MHRSVPGLKIPNGGMARAARNFIRGIETELLYNHSHRVFAFGCLSGTKLGMAVDHELLYVSALFHRVGLTEGYRSSRLRFEVDGANAALRKSGTRLRCILHPELRCINLPLLRF